MALAAVLVRPAFTGKAAPNEINTAVEVYASGLVNPKGLAFTPDGTLYIAESGAPGDVVVALPSGYGGSGPIGRNARISRVRQGGQREDFVTGLPNIGIYGGVEMLGATSVAVLDGQLYEVAAAHMTVSPALSRLGPDGSMALVSDVGAFNHANPPPSKNGDALPQGNPFGLIAVGGNLYITDGNYNRVIKASPGGQLSLLTEFDYDPTTTGIGAGPDGNLYVCQFGQEPYLPGSGQIDRVSLDGKISEGVVKDLTTPIDVAFAPDGTMYILQFASQFDANRRRYVPFGGSVLRLGADGVPRPIVTNLVFPTAMTFGPDAALYVTNYGNESNDARGQVLRIILGDGGARAPDLPAPADTQAPGTSRSEGRQTAPMPTPAPAARTPAATITIVEPTDPQRWGYDPKSVTIQAGESVVFRNSGGAAHTATQSQGAFETGLIAGGQTATVTLAKPGTYTFFCQPHPWMIGTIVVQGASQQAAAPSGTVPADRKPPTINPLRAIAFVVLIIAVVFATGFAMRARPKQPASRREES